MIQYSAKTNIGQRKVNEDSFFIDEELGLYIVADGVGGLAKGEVASKLACQIIYNNIKEGKSLKDAVLAAHNKIIEETNQNEELRGMASTVVAALFDANAYELAWVGDSRAYLWDGGLKLITRDHSYIELLLETGHITFEQMKTHPDRNVISQALGIDRKKLRVATNSGTLEKDQIIMLSTDGLYEIAQEDQVIKQLGQMVNIKSLTTKLVNYAANSEGKDNITLLTIKSDEDSKHAKKIIQPLIVREFDIETGDVVIGIPVDEKEQKEEILPEDLRVKSIAPREMDLDDKPKIEKINILEMILLVCVIILILIITTLNL